MVCLSTNQFLFYLRFSFIATIFSFYFIQSSFSQDFRNVQPLDHWRVDALISSQGIFFNEVWHFERTNRHYAILGSTEGTHFFEVTNDVLDFIGFVPGDFRSAQVHNRDFRDFGDYVYAVADQGQASALQIINISQLPDTVFLEKTDSTNWNRVHTLCVDHQSAMLYACTFTPPAGHPDWFYRPLKVFSLADPLNPALVFSGFSGINEVHYAYVRGDTAYLNCGFDGLRIYDFSNPSNPILLGSLSVYNDQGYNHSGWLSEDGKTYFFTDETDGKRIKMVDVSDVANPQIVRLFGTSNFANAIAHHVIPKGDLLYVSYYTEGLRVFDTRTPIREVAHYDTYPLATNFLMNGAWGVIPFKNGNRVLVSDRTFGLFLFGFDHELFSLEKPNEEFVVFPNPIQQGASLRIKMQNLTIDKFTVQIYDVSGNLVHEERVENQSFAEIKTGLSQGVYTVSIQFINYLNEPDNFSGKIIVF